MVLELVGISEGFILGSILGPPDAETFQVFGEPVKAKWTLANPENLGILEILRIINYPPNPAIILYPTSRKQAVHLLSPWVKRDDDQAIS